MTRENAPLEIHVGIALRRLFFHDASRMFSAHRYSAP